VALNGFFLVAVFAMVGNPFRFGIVARRPPCELVCVFFRLPSRLKNGL
jgi:hypothetical protein